MYDVKLKISVRGLETIYLTQSVNADTLEAAITQSKVDLVQVTVCSVNENTKREPIPDTVEKV